MMTTTVDKATPSGPARPSKLFTIYSNPLPGPNSTSGCKAAQSSTPEAEFQTSRHAPAPTLLAEPMRAPIGPLCEYRLQWRKPLGCLNVYHASVGPTGSGLARRGETPC